MRYQFKDEQWLPFPLETVFAFFANPANLPPLMPDWQCARVEQATLVPPPSAPSGDWPESPVAGSGSKVTLSFRPAPLSPVRLRWEAEIQDFAWYSSFADVQLKGPFAYWRHRHSVSREMRNGIDGTKLTDDVIYEPPMGKLGELANLLFILGQLKQTFAHRHARTLELLSTAKHVEDQLAN